MIGLPLIYAVFGVLLAAYAASTLRDRSNPRRWRTGAFWLLLSVSFLVGDRLGDAGNGALVVGLALLAAFGGLGRGEGGEADPAARRASAERRGNALFIPALVAPATVLVGALALKGVRLGGVPLLQPRQETLASLVVGVGLGLAVALAWLRPPLSAPVREGRRLAELVSWAAFLPQLLAALGAVFAVSGVGQAMGRLIGDSLPLDSRLAVVVVYTGGMALFTALMGNAFAAFPIMTAAVGLPLIVGRFGGDPAVMGALGMLSGFSGTLLTPLAANFNLVPVTLLDLPDRWAVIRAQAPTALLMLGVNTALMYALAFHR